MDHPTGSANAGGWGTRSEADRWLEIAGRLLLARDLVGSKRFAERAMEVDPLLEGVDEVLAVADVLLASQRRVNNHLDWYSILQVDPNPPPDTSALKLSYRRLGILLNPDKNHHPGADAAFKLVSDAWSFLSDPTRKRLYDDEVRIATAHPQSNGNDHPRTPSPPPSQPPPIPQSFWTICSNCFRAHEHELSRRGKTLLCHGCQKSFVASELPSSPPIVPGTDMYYCSWGLFPLGFPGCPAFTGVQIPDGVAKTSFFLLGDGGKGGPGGGEKAPMPVTSPGKVVVKEAKKVKAAKQPTGRPRGRPRKDRGVQMEGGSQVKDAGVINEGVAHNVGDIGVGFDMNSFSIDLDATAEVLGNFSHLPFMRDDEVVMMR